MCQHFRQLQQSSKNKTNPANMENIYETIDERSVHEKRSDGADSPDPEPKYENSGGAKEQLYSDVQVHVCAEEERSSPLYMDIRDGDKQSSSSSSSSDDEEAKAEGVAEVRVEPVVQVEEMNGEAHEGSRRSSASSASSASPGDPCDDPPIQPRIQEEENAENGMLMAYTHPNNDSTPEESVDYSLKTLENVTLDESSAAPADPSQPDISLFVKVRSTLRLQRTKQSPQGLTWPGQASVCFSLTVQHEASHHESSWIQVGFHFD